MTDMTAQLDGMIADQRKRFDESGKAIAMLETGIKEIRRDIESIEALPVDADMAEAHARIIGGFLISVTILSFLFAAFS